ncbi:type II/IV secretion system protein [Patescibacteria group bacterium]|nr:MAG: type II/IV secretion system protein [Patescibacteria group bacterium]
MLSAKTQQNLEELLLERNVLTSKQLDDFKLQAIQDNEPLLAVIQKAGIIDEETMVRYQAMANGLQYVNLAGVVVSADVLNRLNREVAEGYHSVPFGRVQGRLAVAMLDPTNIQAVDFLSRKVGEQIVTFMASQASIDAVLLQYSAEISGDIKKAIQTVDAENLADAKREGTTSIQTLVQDAPISRALSTILEYAVNSRASDIHIEPREKDLRIRFRIDGVLQETMKLPKSIEPALISRIKILSNLKIDEHRIPQDGSFQVHAGKKFVDLRIAIAPITFGEQVVIRLLDKDNTLLTLENLGFSGIAYQRIKEGIHKPHGMVLATGPTGSGKSTTLYASIMEIKDVKVNIVTLEDPVEYKMDGINQIQVNSDVGLTFASGLRSILRQDPNVVMVGEIRDGETANLAVQAALTGHIVLSTIHTNSAAGVLPRLLDMKVEPFLVGSTVNTVIGQRLVRRVCPTCKKERKATQAEAESINKTLSAIIERVKKDPDQAKKDIGYDVLPSPGQNAYTLFEGQGCKDCKDGYKGRVGIYEVFAMTPEMEKLLTSQATTTQVQNLAQEQGMVTMKQDGYLKVLNGVTTLSEVARVASDF